MATTEIPNNISWTCRLENYFASTGERAHCLSWAHQRSENIYAIRRTFIDLPVIALSSLTGFFSVGQATIFYANNNPNESNNLANIFLGIVSLFVSVLNTTGAYFGWAKKSEAHRIAGIHFAKLYRFISVELALPRDQRSSPHDFLKYVKEQYDRLTETSPAIPDCVIKDFKKKFPKEAMEGISIPEIMNGLESIHVYDHKDLKTDLELEYASKKIESEYARNIISSETNSIIFSNESTRRPHSDTKQDIP
jgi:hypothetical protein